MPRPPEGYRLADGTKVPGVTDITRRYANKEGLINWARSQGFAQAKAGYAKADHWDHTARETGHVVHGMNELFLKGRNSDQVHTYAASMLTDPAELKKAHTAHTEFRNWAKSVRLEVVAIEVSLVSERYRYGGTLDKIAWITIVLCGRLRRLLCIVDPKNVKTVTDLPFAEYLEQLAGYRHLWEEDPANPRIQGFVSLCCAKDGTGCKAHFYEHLRDQFRSFLDHRRTFERDRRLALPAALAGIPIELPPAAKPAKPVVLKRAKIKIPRTYSTYDLRISTNFQTAAGGSHIPAAVTGAAPVALVAAPSAFQPAVHVPHAAGAGAARAIPPSPEAKPDAAPNHQLPPQGAGQRSTAQGSGGDPGRREDSPGDISIPEFLLRNGPGWDSFNEANHERERGERT